MRYGFGVLFAPSRSLQRSFLCPSSPPWCYTMYSISPTALFLYSPVSLRVYNPQLSALRQERLQTPLSSWYLVDLVLPQELCLGQSQVILGRGQGRDDSACSVGNYTLWYAFAVVGPAPLSHVVTFTHLWVSCMSYSISTSCWVLINIFSWYAPLLQVVEPRLS